jgi:hypothetical protein
MMPLTITILPFPTPQPDPNNPNGSLLPVFEIETYLWNERHHKKATTKLGKYKENMAHAYIIIFHQCMPSLKSKIEANDCFQPSAPNRIPFPCSRSSNARDVLMTPRRRV